MERYVDVTEHGGAIVVAFKCAGNIALAIEGVHRSLLDMARRLKPGESVIIDLRGVRFLSSRLIGALMSMGHRAHAAQGSAMLLGTNPRIREALDRLCAGDLQVHQSETP